MLLRVSRPVKAAQGSIGRRVSGGVLLTGEADEVSPCPMHE